MAYLSTAALVLLALPFGLGALLAACRDKGFDPWQLSCRTCENLPLSYKNDCLACCQPYKDSEFLQDPYHTAVLLVHRSASEELESFLRDDWDGLVSTRRFLTKQSFDSPWLSSGTLLFFDKAPQKNDINAMFDQAKEVINLNGWKRDEIKDMLSSLLPLIQ
jgi:hypothetical protein